MGSGVEDCRLFWGSPTPFWPTLMEPRKVEIFFKKKICVSYFVLCQEISATPRRLSYTSNLNLWPVFWARREKNSDLESGPNLPFFPPPLRAFLHTQFIDGAVPWSAAVKRISESKKKKNASQWTCLFFGVFVWNYFDFTTRPCKGFEEALTSMVL